jgi:periplasmic protein TonB
MSGRRWRWDGRGGAGTSGMGNETAAAVAIFISQERAPSAPALLDRWQRWRALAALVAALLIHALIALLLLVTLPFSSAPVLPPPIPVEIVMVPPTPETSKPPPELKSQSMPLTLPPRESGGDANLKQGERADAVAKDKIAPAPEPKPASAEPETAVKTEAPAPSAEEKVKPLPTAPKLPPARPQASLPDPSRLVGEGGGDRYLNAIRDELLKHRVYPDAARAHGIAGTAVYRLVVDRQGKVLSVALLHSSGYHELDDAGLETIELTAPLQPLPYDIPGDRVALVLTLFIGPP